ncbi:ABC-type nitrate/sulfonate/bicarbonate transport system substrate-binding protein [Paenibacillus sp. PvP052]|nr:ABC-type nitrate/sulfonate/bicarbonate transport system substrate-binding protein [Paenibacillus sp. PvP052]
MGHIKSRLLWQGAAVVLSVILAMSLMGCTQKNGIETMPNPGSTESAKKMPAEMTRVNMGLPSKSNTSYLPLYVAVKKGYFQKQHLDVSFNYVQGGVLALRGLQTGDFQIISSLPESVITGVAEGADVKFIGTLDNQSMYSIYVSKEISDLKDLKGKTAAGNVPGNGTTIQLEYWLKKHGLEPNQDVRITNAGDNASRLQALQQGQAAVTILSPPTDLKADELGLQRYLMRDELTTYNHNMIVTNGKLIDNKPEVVHAFMAATAEAVTFIKDPANRDEVIQIAVEEMEMTQANVQKSFDFVLPALADKGKINMDGVKWAIDTVKAAGMLTKDIRMDQLVDERFYMK